MSDMQKMIAIAKALKAAIAKNEPDLKDPIDTAASVLFFGKEVDDPGQIKRLVHDLFGGAYGALVTQLMSNAETYIKENVPLFKFSWPHMTPWQHDLLNALSNITEREADIRVDDLFAIKDILPMRAGYGRPTK